MEIFQLILQPLQKLVENSLGLISNSIFNALSSAKVEVKETAEQCTNLLLNSLDASMVLQHLCHGILYALPKSRIYLVNKLETMV